MQVSSIKSIDKRQLWNTFEISSNTSLFADFFKASVSSRTANWFFSSAKTRARYFNSVSVHARSFSGAGFPAIFLQWAQALGLCEHILYPTAKRPLALCIEVLIPESKFVCRCIYTHRRIIRPDGLSTLVRLPRRTTQIVRLDG